MEPIDKQHFWNNKILKWEKDKYSDPKSKLGRFFDVNQSLKKRQQIAKNILKQNAMERTVLEIGCGTARLLHSVFEAGATKYIGIDISKKAIQEGQKNARELKIERFTEFYHLDVNALNNINNIKADICFSLGLLDWLSLEEIEQMLSFVRCKFYFHSYSQRNMSFQQLLHRFYVYMFYGYRTKSYVPKYYTKEKILKLFTSTYKFPAKHFQSKKSFMSFVYDLPNDFKIVETKN